MKSRPGWFRAIVSAVAAFFAVGVTHAQESTFVRLTLNENPFGPSPIVLKALAESLGGLYRYVGDEAAALTEQIAALESVSPEQVVLGEMLDRLGLELSLQGGPGGEFVYSVPGYAALVDAAARVGGVVLGVPLNAQLENDLPAITAKLTTRTRAVFLVNPHNPSGTVNDGAAFLEFVRKVSKQTLVIVDEAYLEFDDDFRRRSAISLVRTGENVMVFRTFSKAHGLAALPFGYAVAPRPLAEYLHRQGLGFSRDQNRLALTAASASLRDPAHIDRVRAQVAAERAKWYALLDGLRLRHTEARANFVFFDAGRPHAEVAKALLAQGVSIGRAFPPYQTWVRITIGLPQENARAQAAVRRLFTSGGK